MKFEEIYRKSLKESISDLNDMEMDEILVDFIELTLNDKAPLDDVLLVISQNWNIEKDDVYSIINKLKDIISSRGLYHQ